jgi:hypothetical protein
VYILHQTIIVCLGYLVVRTALPLALKYAVLLIAAMAGTLGLVSLLRRCRLTRALLGSK